MKNRSLLLKSLRAQILCGFLLAFASIGLTSCHSDNYYAYKFPQYTFANRPVPPSKLANRVMVCVTINGTTTGSLQILDAKRDIRSNIQNTITSFSISGYAAGYPDLILNFPAEITGYVYSAAQGDIQIINYGKEATAGAGGTFPARSTGLAVPPTFSHVYSAEESIGQLGVIDNSTGRTFGLVLPNVFQVVVNAGDNVVLAMVRNSNTIYRLVKLNPNQFPTAPRGRLSHRRSRLPALQLCPSTASSPSTPALTPTPSIIPPGLLLRSTEPPPTSSTAAPSAAAQPPASPLSSPARSSSTTSPPRARRLRLPQPGHGPRRSHRRPL